MHEIQELQIINCRPTARANFGNILFHLSSENVVCSKYGFVNSDNIDQKEEEEEEGEEEGFLLIIYTSISCTRVSANRTTRLHEAAATTGNLPK
jgi:hypothetical protein